MADPSLIAARIAEKLNAPSLVDALVALPQSELQSLLLFVQRRRSSLRTPAELLRQYERAAMVQPSAADARALHAIDACAYEAAKDFEAVELSPVAPVGVNVVLGAIDQNNSLATLRGAEVMADPTTALALECVLRRRKDPAATVKLCTSARMMRLQPFDMPGYSPHFRLFALVTAGRDRGDDAFQTDALAEQLRFYLAWMARLEILGYRFADIQVAVADTEACRARAAAAAVPERATKRLHNVEERIFPSLRADFPSVKLTLEPDRTHAIHYYDGLCMHVNVTDPEGQRYPFADGGFTDWTQRIAGNRKERMMVSGAGSELVAKRFRGGG
jgi:hypothetical protein